VKEAGAEVELVYVADLTVKACLGCFTCWLKTLPAVAREIAAREAIHQGANARFKQAPDGPYCFSVSWNRARILWM